MNVATSTSGLESTRDAFAEVVANITSTLGTPPGWLYISYTARHDAAALAQAAGQLPGATRVHGSSTAAGVMTAEGARTGAYVLAALGIADTDGGYGVAGEPLGAAPRDAAARAMRGAVEDAGRPGEIPDLVWLTAAPGDEEEVLLGIADVVGPHVPVYGGSSAAESITGGWSQVANGAAYTTSVTVTALYPDGAISHAFSAGYAPTGRKGRVTSGGGRILRTIDGAPAAEIYNRWTDGAIAPMLNGGDVLEASTLRPLGRVAGTIAGVDQYALIHLNTVLPDGALTLGAAVREGEDIELLSGSRDTLIVRGGGVASDALRLRGPEFRPKGALVTFCAGCMLAVRDQLAVVASGVAGALPDTPFLGSFTFGEQGCFGSGESRHGNLGVSAVLFG